MGAFWTQEAPRGPQEGNKRVTRLILAALLHLGRSYDSLGRSLALLKRSWAFLLSDFRTLRLTFSLLFATCGTKILTPTRWDTLGYAKIRWALLEYARIRQDTLGYAGIR